MNHFEYFFDLVPVLLRISAQLCWSNKALNLQAAAHALLCTANRLLTSVRKDTMNKKWNIDKGLEERSLEKLLSPHRFLVFTRNVHSHVHFESIWHFVNLIVQEQSGKDAWVHGTRAWQIQECKPALKYRLTLFPHDQQAEAHVKSPQRVILALWCFIILSGAVRGARWQHQTLNLSALERRSEAIRQQYWLKVTQFLEPFLPTTHI